MTVVTTKMTREGFWELTLLLEPYKNECSASAPFEPKENCITGSKLSFLVCEKVSLPMTLCGSAAGTHMEDPAQRGA